MILVDPKTREPLPPLPGERPRPKYVEHWLIVREGGLPVGMEWRFCDDETCCPPFEEETR